VAGDDEFECAAVLNPHTQDVKRVEAQQFAEYQIKALLALQTGVGVIELALHYPLGANNGAENLQQDVAVQVAAGSEQTLTVGHISNLLRQRLV